PSTKPARITGIRPTRSDRWPAGPTAAAPAIRKTAGPRPRMLLTPVTATIVTVPSATASWIIPDRQTSPPASRIELRRAGVTRAAAPARAETPSRRRETDGARTHRRTPRGRHIRPQPHDARPQDRA